MTLTLVTPYTILTLFWSYNIQPMKFNERRLNGTRLIEQALEWTPAMT